MKKTEKLREMLASGRTLLMPDAYDPISARVIQSCGFHAVQCSGCSIAIANCLKHESELSLDQNLDATRKIVSTVDVPVMADGEDGYGGPERIEQTIAAFVEAGVAGINIEDQVISATDGVAVVEQSYMVEKLQAAREAAEAAGNPHLIINGRTDVLLAWPDRDSALSEAIRRANAYLGAGADLAFVAYVSTLDEAHRAVREIEGPVSIAAGQSYNIREFSIEDLCRCGVARISLPTLAILSSIQALSTAMVGIHESHGFQHVLAGDMLCPWQRIQKLIE